MLVERYGVDAIIFPARVSRWLGGLFSNEGLITRINRPRQRFGEPCLARWRWRATSAAPCRRAEIEPVEEIISIARGLKDRYGRRWNSTPSRTRPRSSSSSHLNTSTRPPLGARQEEANRPRLATVLYNLLECVASQASCSRQHARHLAQDFRAIGAAGSITPRVRRDVGLPAGVTVLGRGLFRAST
ncbi:MAG: hypothetical protein ACLVL7_11140 [Anaerotruncus massiliensis (ex Togo et al. 2019)]